MAASSENDDALLISNEEIELWTGAEISEEDDLFLIHPDRGTDQYHSSTEQGTERQINNAPSRFGAAGVLGRWAKILLKWWRTLVIIVTPLILLLLFAVAEDTRVRIVV